VWICNPLLSLQKQKIVVTANQTFIPQEINLLGLNRRINYYYNFDGAKLRKRVENNGTLTKVDYCGPFIYETASGVRSLKYLVTPYGRAVKNGSSWIYEYNLTDLPITIGMGNVRVVIRKGANNLAEVVQERHYYPFGMEMSELSYNYGSTVPNKYLYNGKELENDYGIYLYDYGARFYDSHLGRFHTNDPMAEKIPDYTPYNYVRNNPILRIDPTGKWDVTVHLYNNRAIHGYGVAIVSDRKGNEIYRFDVRAEGWGGRDRTKKNADTLLGVYDIPNNLPWLSGKSRKSYGPNFRLNMNPISGEAAEITTRTVSDIRIHGGGQEEEGTWEPLENPELKKTYGCLRAWDKDMANFKNATDVLMSNDPLEYAGRVTIQGDLKQKKSWIGVPYGLNVTKTTYHAPGEDASSEDMESWNSLVNSILNR
jgi:RHS repeat-associated protein